MQLSFIQWQSTLIIFLSKWQPKLYKSNAFFLSFISRWRPKFWGIDTECKYYVIYQIIPIQDSLYQMYLQYAVVIFGKGKWFGVFCIKIKYGKNLFKLLQKSIKYMQQELRSHVTLLQSPQTVNSHFYATEKSWFNQTIFKLIAHRLSNYRSGEASIDRHIR